MRYKKCLASFVAAVALSLSMSACKDTKTLQENEQLKTQVADLQKQVGQLGNNIETLTADRDALTKENESLKAELKPRKKNRRAKKTSVRKHGGN
jgi:peptidoglycan hydrolase CwlO-like protein